MKKFLAFLLLGAILLCAGCSSATGKLEKIKSSGKMTVYTDPNFSPFEFLVDGKPTGVDIEIAKAIAAELGAKDIKFKEANFDSILMAIKDGKGDIAISGITISDERKESVDFSDPYINSVQYLILAEGSTIAVMEDLAGKKVGVAKGYTGQFLMEDEIKDGVLAGAGTELLEYNSALEATIDLQNGRVEAVVMDEYVAKNIATQNNGIEAKELRYKDGSVASEEYGVALPKGNEDLLAIINGVIKKLLEEDKIREWVIQYS